MPRRLAVLVLAAAAHAACWTAPTAVRGGRVAAQRKTVLLVDQAAPFRVTMRPDAAGALGVEVDANECGAAVITKIVRNSQVSELLEVGDAPQLGRTRAPSAQATAEHRPASAGKGRANLPRHRAAQAGTERPQAEVTRRAPRTLCAVQGKGLSPPTAHRTAPRTARCTALCAARALHQWRSRSTLGHARYLPPMLRYLTPQVVVQVNGCDTPTLGAVVDVVSAQASPATAKPLPPTLLARSTCMASLVADYRPVHLTEEPLHTPRLPLRGRRSPAMLPSYHPSTGARHIRAHHGTA